MRQGAELTLVGIGAGLVVALGLTRVMSGLLYEVSALDPVVFACISLFLVVIGITASFVPALRAARIEPVATLREE